MSLDLLPTVLDRLLPGDDELGWPSASDIELPRKALKLAAERDATGALETLLAKLPGDFATLEEAGQVAALEALEGADPDGFATLILYAYGAYYTDAGVRCVVEARTGYPARPPQPKGYALPPFDESLLATVRQRAPFWRKVEG
ncbi:hypothetical protein [Acuticoccus mangrovi]|uniref:Gluconate 2-dehydrogenase subunit 3 family protein n=1 Tax=Acuticoccus mangrovi TaxID=2796142 RepID=A0A934MCS0_9HYPH|nr:hypothetical protein [Acuticoccus mangrovi]MBJ3775572.1 hypothetical protein [Acuticoccus mangrovi]